VANAIGYACLSPGELCMELRNNALQKVCRVRGFIDHGTGQSMDRPELSDLHACLNLGDNYGPGGGRARG
jgi:hypothetical protein